MRVCYMGMYEDSFYEVFNKIESLGLREEYDTQMKKMQQQDKHKWLDTKSRMQYCCDKVVERSKKIKNEKRI